MGVSLHRKRLSVSITNLASVLLDQVQTPTQDYHDYASALAWIFTAIEEMIERNHIPSSKIIGIGVSSPGPLDYRGGTILVPPNFDLFHHVPIVALLKEKFDLPVLLENNAVLLALTEYFNGSMKEYRNSMFVILSDGIGSCMLMDGKIYRGFGGYAGELGHTSIDIHGPKCTCGNQGCLELYATLTSLKREFHFESYETVVDDAYRGASYALDILKYQAQCLSCALIGAVNMLDLDAIILYGEFNYRPELLFSLLNSRISKGSMIQRVHPVSVIPSGLKNNAAAISSTAAVLNRYFNQQL